MALRYRDRRDAGRHLARKLARYANRPDVLALALPRGGVPVAFEVARTLHTPLDVFLVRKLGVPGHEELAMGALASGGTCFVDRHTVSLLGISDEVLDAVIGTEQRELARRERVYRSHAEPLDLSHRTAILIDDGLATGSSMKAAVAAIHQRMPARVVVAVPVASQQACQELAGVCDEIVCGMTPEPFFSVGIHYHDFSQTTDEEVRALLRAAHGEVLDRIPDVVAS